MYINSFNHFRAIAILLIVAGHTIKVSGLNFDSMIEYTFLNIITGGTSIFVFISGFLFHHIFYKKYQFKDFIKGKFKNVLIPYLLLSLLPVCLFALKKTDGWGGYFLPNGSGLFNEYIVPSIQYLWTGAFLAAYWYIPFIMITFLLSPLHFLFIKSKSSVQISLTIVFLIVSLLIHRPIYGLSVLQSVVYFTPVYLIGILCSIHKDKIYSTLSGKEPILLIIAFMLAALQAHLGVFENYWKHPFVYGGLDIMLIQKIFLCLFFMVYLNRFESYKSKFVQTLADTSFAVFFLHPFVLWVLEHKVLLQYVAIDFWPLYLLLTVLITLLCVAIAKLTKRIIPDYSRYFIGY